MLLCASARELLQGPNSSLGGAVLCHTRKSDFHGALATCFEILWCLRQFSGCRLCAGALERPGSAPAGLQKRPLSAASGTSSHGDPHSPTSHASSAVVCALTIHISFDWIWCAPGFARFHKFLVKQAPWEVSQPSVARQPSGG